MDSAEANYKYPFRAVATAATKLYRVNRAALIKYCHEFSHHDTIQELKRNGMLEERFRSAVAHATVHHSRPNVETEESATLAKESNQRVLAMRSRNDEYGRGKDAMLLSLEEALVLNTLDEAARIIDAQEEPASKVKVKFDAARKKSKEMTEPEPFCPVHSFPMPPAKRDTSREHEIPYLNCSCGSRRLGSVKPGEPTGLAMIPLSSGGLAITTSQVSAPRPFWSSRQPTELHPGMEPPEVEEDIVDEDDSDAASPEVNDAGGEAQQHSLMKAVDEALSKGQGADNRDTRLPSRHYDPTAEYFKFLTEVTPGDKEEPETDSDSEGSWSSSEICSSSSELVTDPLLTRSNSANLRTPPSKSPAPKIEHSQDPESVLHRRGVGVPALALPGESEAPTALEITVDTLFHCTVEHHSAPGESPICDNPAHVESDAGQPQPKPKPKRRIKAVKHADQSEDGRRTVRFGKRTGALQRPITDRDKWLQMPGFMRVNSSQDPPCFGWVTQRGKSGMYDAMAFEYKRRHGVDATLRTEHSRTTKNGVEPTRTRGRQRSDAAKRALSPNSTKRRQRPR